MISVHGMCASRVLYNGKDVGGRRDEKVYVEGGAQITYLVIRLRGSRE